MLEFDWRIYHSRRPIISVFLFQKTNCFAQVGLLVIHKKYGVRFILFCSRCSLRISLNFFRDSECLNSTEGSIFPCVFSSSFSFSVFNSSFVELLVIQMKHVQTLLYFTWKRKIWRKIISFIYIFLWIQLNCIVIIFIWIRLKDLAFPYYFFVL